LKRLPRAYRKWAHILKRANLRRKSSRIP